MSTLTLIIAKAARAAAVAVAKVIRTADLAAGGARTKRAAAGASK